MTASIRPLRTIAFSGILACLFMFPALADDTDDGWRRTKDGWEHVSTWDIPRAHLPYKAAPLSAAERIWQAWDFSALAHPGMIALGLLLVGWAGLALPATWDRPAFAACES